MGTRADRDVVRDALSVKDAAEHYNISLKRVGNDWVGATSNKSKSGKSLFISGNNWYKDHAHPDSQGDVFQFIATQEGLDNSENFVEILHIAAKIAGVTLSGIKVDSSEKISIRELYSHVVDYYHSNTTDEHREYALTKWGITSASIDEFKIGFAPLDKLTSLEGLDRQTLIKSGLVRKAEREYENHFNGRIMFPYWKGGKCVFMIGAITDDTPSWEIERGIKYSKMKVFDKEKSPYVSKDVQNSLYGEDSVRKTDFMVITEGVTDCIMAIQSGFPCVSPVTISFRKQDYPKILSIAKRVKTVYLCNDNEDNHKGIDGAISTAEHLTDNGINVKIITLPLPTGSDKIDLAEFLRDNPATEFNKLMDAAEPLWKVKLHMLPVSNDPVENAQSAVTYAVNDIKYLPKAAALNVLQAEVKKYFNLHHTVVESIQKDVFGAGADKETSAIDADEYFDDNAFIPKRLADHIMNKYTLITPVAPTDNATKVPMYVYKGGVYVRGGEAIVLREAQDALGEQSRKARIEEVIKHIRISTFSPADPFNHSVEIINVANGLLNWRTGELSPHTPKHLSTIQINAEWDDTAMCPMMDAFLDVAIESKDRPVIEEFVGYMLIPDISEQKTLFIHNPEGGSGKSTFLDALGAFFGECNVSGESLHQLENDQYSVANLRGKLANIFPDLDPKAISSNAVLKQIATDKYLRGEEKYISAGKFRNFTRVVFAANKLPEVPDDPAYFDRVILVKFPHRFRGTDEDIKDYSSVLSTQEERNGILCMAVEGLRRLKANGGFSYKASTKETAMMFEIHGSSAKAFIKHCLIYSHKDVSKTMLWGEYVEWCNNFGVDALTEQKFSRVMKNAGYEDHRGGGEDRAYIWLNVELKPENETVQTEFAQDSSKSDKSWTEDGRYQEA